MQSADDTWALYSTSRRLPLPTWHSVSSKDFVGEKKNAKQAVLKVGPEWWFCDTRRACDSETPRRACDSELQIVLQVYARAHRHLALPFCSCPICPLSGRGLPTDSWQENRVARPRFGPACVFADLQVGPACARRYFWPLENTKNFGWKFGRRLGWRPQHMNWRSSGGQRKEGPHTWKQSLTTTAWATPLQAPRYLTVPLTVPALIWARSVFLFFVGPRPMCPPSDLARSDLQSAHYMWMEIRAALPGGAEFPYKAGRLVRWHCPESPNFIQIPRASSGGTIPAAKWLG